MMHVTAMRSFGAVITSLVCGAFVACAGSDTPPVNDELEDAINQSFGRGTASAGASTGSGPTGSAGSSSMAAAGRGGAPARPPANTEDDPPVASAGAGGAGAEPEDDPPANSGACDGFVVLNTKCNGGSCHGDGSGLGDFAASEEAALAFIGQNGPGGCSGEGPLIDPENPRQSVIMQKVLGTASCGSPMPLGIPLEDSEIDCIEEWIGSL